MALRLHNVMMIWIGALLLATIGFQAAVPAEAADRSPGSAFSAQTHEVALAPHEEVRTTPSIPPSPPGPPAAALSLRPIVVRGTPAPRSQSTGPPASHLSVQLPHPRGPPLA